MQSQEKRGRHRQHRHMERVEASQRRTGYVRPSLEDSADKRTQQGHRRHDLRPDSRGEVGQLVPGQEVPRETEPHREPEQEDARQPGDLARSTVGLQQQYAEQMKERREYHQVRRPMVYRADQPAEVDLRHQELNRLVRVLSARPVVEEKQNASNDLD